LLPAAAGAQFEAHTITRDIRFGYQVLAADLNRDGRTDVVALGAQMPELLWFENPGWERHVITAEAAGMINMDASDTDGDGIPEIGLAYGFSTNPSAGEGNIAVLKHTGDPTEAWELTEIDAVPASHRIRFGDIDGDGDEVLVNAPILHGDATGFEDPDRLPTPLVFYRPGDWERRSITEENQGVVHGLMLWDGDGDGRHAVVSAGRLGIHAHLLGDDGTWLRERLSVGVDAPYPNGGSSDLGAGRLGDDPFFVAIEPFHGNQVAVYRRAAGTGWQRQVIDTELVNGHSLLVADLSGDGNGEIVAAGTRGPKNLYLYRAVDGTGETWERAVIDDAIAANSCDAADFNGDGRTDVVCIDNTAPFSVKWYENTGDW
jgi:hypothetical protein